MYKVNRYLINSLVKLKCFPGANIKQLIYYTVPSLIDETPNGILIHGGCNDISNKTSTPATLQFFCWKWQKSVVDME